MVTKKLYLVGPGESSAQSYDIGTPKSLEELRAGVASLYSILSVEGIRFHHQSAELQTVADILASDPIGITVDGNAIREPHAPEGLPFFGNHFEIFPDHVGNHRRLFARYGSVIKTNNMGRITYLANTPEIAQVVLKEGEYFTKAPSVPDHPLHGIRDAAALFVCDTDDVAWKDSHKFIPPSMTPRAVKHYTPVIQKSIDASFSVLDQIDARGDAFNVHQFTAKLTSQVICQLVLGFDLHHFESVDTPLHRIIHLIEQYLTLNRRVQSKGTWYQYLPFGDPAHLQQVRKELYSLIDDAVQDAKRKGGTADLPIHTAALHASSIVDYLVRATDENGKKLAPEYVLSNAFVLVAAGFVTSAGQLAWLIHALTTYDPGRHQDRLLQELVDHGARAGKAWTFDEIQALPFLDAFVKETQRLHGTSFQPARNARRDVVLPGGWRVPAGAIVVPSLPHLHRRADLWDNPDRFDPDRWATDAVRARHRAAFIPFAAGARGCVGFNAALQELKIALAELVFRYRFVAASPAPIEYDPEFTLLVPVNCYARAVRRTAWPEPRPLREDRPLQNGVGGKE